MWRGPLVVNHHLSSAEDREIQVIFWPKRNTTRIGYNSQTGVVRDLFGKGDGKNYDHAEKQCGYLVSENGEEIKLPPSYLLRKLAPDAKIRIKGEFVINLTIECPQLRIAKLVPVSVSRTFDDAWLLEAIGNPEVDGLLVARKESAFNKLLPRSSTIGQLIERGYMKHMDTIIINLKFARSRRQDVTTKIRTHIISGTNQSMRSIPCNWTIKHILERYVTEVSNLSTCIVNIYNPEGDVMVEDLNAQLGTFRGQKRLATELTIEVTEKLELVQIDGHAVRKFSSNELKKEDLAGMHGNFGGVYKYVYSGNPQAGDERQTFAVKWVKNVAGDSYAQKTYNHELSALARLNNRHPCIISLVGVVEGDDNSEYYGIVMPYLPNTVQTYIKSEACGEKKLSNTEKTKILVGVASGLAYMHSKNIVHRDIKLANVLVNDDLHPFIADMGTVRDLDELSETGATGTPVYMAPEMCLEDGYFFSPKSDVFAWGAMMFYMVTCQETFFPGTTSKYSYMRKICDGKRPNVPDVFTQPFQDLLEKCWDGDPEVRPTFDEILDFFDNYDYQLFEDVDGNAVREFVETIQDLIVHTSTLSDRK